MKISHLPPQGGVAEAARKGEYGQDTGSVDPSQAKCELGINKNVTIILVDCHIGILSLCIRCLVRSS